MKSPQGVPRKSAGDTNGVLELPFRRFLGVKFTEWEYSSLCFAEIEDKHESQSFSEVKISCNAFRSLHHQFLLFFL